MRRWLPFLILLAAAAPLPASAPDVATAAAQDPGVVQLAADTEARWIAFDLTPGNQIQFEVVLDDRVVAAILDTGVSYSVLARRSAAADPARVRAGGSATAIGGAVDVGWMQTRSLLFGGLTRTGGGVGVADLPALATGSAKPVDMLVGRDLTAGHALDIDYAHHRFRVLRSGRLPFRGFVAPLSVSSERRVYESRMLIGTARLSPMVVDTGDGSAVTVSQIGWGMAGLDTLPTTSAIAYGLAGPAISDLAIVPALRLGQLVAHQVEVRGEPRDGFSQVIGVAGRIGSGFLQHYRVLLDPGAGRMVLDPGPDADRAPVRSTSGLLVGVARDRLRVLHVMRGGPAAASGWKDGDTICAIDGKPIPADYPTNPIAAWSVGPPGRTVALTACGGGSTRMLTLRHFY